MNKLLFWLATACTFLLLPLYFLHPVTNLVGDLGYYLKTGEIIVTTHSIPQTNLFSYTYPNYSFINPNWLSEVFLFLVYKLLSFNGLIFLSILLICSSFSLVYFYAAKTVDWFATIIVALLSLQVLFERTDVKPELFSYLFLSLFLVILYTFHTKSTKWVYALIPLMLLWVNTHIYFFIGMGVLALFFIAEIVRQKNFFSQQVKTLSLVSGVSLFACLLNPNGFKGAIYPFVVLNNYAFPVEENINFATAWNYQTHDPTLIFFLFYVGLLWLGVLFYFKKLSLIDILLALSFPILGFSAVRTFPLVIFTTFIPLVKIVSLASYQLFSLINKKRSLLEYTLSAALCLLLIPTIFSFLNINGVGLGSKDVASPAIAFIKQNHLQGPIYNNYDLGNYLDFSLYPTEKVFADARPEAYPKQFFQNVYFPIQESYADFQQVSQHYHVNLIIIKHTDPSESTIHQLAALTSHTDWQMVFLNHAVVIFLKNSPENKTFIASHLITEKNFTPTSSEITDKESIREYSNFFRAVGWDQQWLEMNLHFIQFDPTNCAALQNIAYIYQKHHAPQTQSAINTFVQTCVH